MFFVLFVVNPWFIFINITVMDSMSWFNSVMVSDSVYARYLILSNDQVFDTKGEPEKTAQRDSFQNSWYYSTATLDWLNIFLSSEMSQKSFDPQCESWTKQCFLSECISEAIDSI